MSVSSRDKKSVIYAELERFREIADHQRNNNLALEDELARRYAQINSLNERIADLERQVGDLQRQQPQRPRPATNFEARRKAAIELCKQLGVRSVTKDQVDEYLAT